MDQHESDNQAWLDEVLDRARTHVSRMVRVNSPRRPAVQRSNPWEETDEIEAAARMLGVARGPGNEPGHMIFVTDVEEDPVARVQAAVQIARAAVGQGLDVLMVDADVRQVGLSRWLPDRDLDAEGMVDILQYGASVAAARRPSMIDGIDVLGIGSYRPDVAQIFGEDDLRRLCVQLRSGAGLIVVVGSARLVEGDFHPLIGEADSVVVSMHLDRALATPLGEFLEYLVGSQLHVAGMFLWAGPDDSEQFVDDALLERSRVLPRAVVDSPFPGRGASDSPVAEPEPEAGAPVKVPPDLLFEIPVKAPEEPVFEKPVTAPLPVVEEKPVVKQDSVPKSVRIKTERVRPGSRSRSGGSSGMVRGVMIAVVVVIVGFTGWWAMTWRSAGPTRPRVEPPERPVVAAQTADSDETAVAVDSAVTQAPGPGESAAVGDAGEELTPVEDVETSRDVDGLLAAPVESAPALADQEPEEPAAAVDPFETALRRRSGSGWGLHLFSFPDSMEAVNDSRGLQRDGYAVAVRGEKIKGQRWYRVLVGSFDTRAEAARFRVQAQEKFGVDWVGVEKK